MIYLCNLDRILFEICVPLSILMSLCSKVKDGLFM